MTTTSERTLVNYTVTDGVAIIELTNRRQTHIATR